MDLSEIINLIVRVASIICNLVTGVKQYCPECLRLMQELDKHARTHSEETTCPGQGGPGP